MRNEKTLCSKFDGNEMRKRHPSREEGGKGNEKAIGGVVV